MGGCKAGIPRHRHRHPREDRGREDVGVRVGVVECELNYGTDRQTDRQTHRGTVQRDAAC